MLNSLHEYKRNGTVYKIFYTKYYLEKNWSKIQIFDKNKIIFICGFQKKEALAYIDIKINEAFEQDKVNYKDEWVVFTADENEEIDFLGNKYYLKFAYHLKTRTQIDINEQKRHLIFGMDPKYRENPERRFKQMQKALIDILIHYITPYHQKLSDDMNCTQTPFNIKLVKGFWGRNTTKIIEGNKQNFISYNLKLITLAHKYIYNVIAHELVHNSISRHNKIFFDEVEKFARTRDLKFPRTFFQPTRYII
ncbi:hypothetical protein MCFN_00660 [Mycoplasmopsis californica]|uniref:YgjP-like metallopeptidase domain-containing protein n=1 Tax=Mycoplasmopsis californica TaxID=2113 RepID=A0A059XVQ0_9BACT|nr:YgjP-like metallopeptidase domain-containing protein [Mycoplasmopsis californica]AIA29297.1 hypothetical protein MCFN_00660 [Mycoplasmopsis californica]